MDSVELLLTTALRHRILEPTIEAAYERFVALSGASIPIAAFHDVVAYCLRERLIREPVRLLEGALQCHWHLELTPKGVDAARRAVAAGNP
jgi:hypothetical protein